MYKISTIIAGGNPIEIPLSKEYEYDIDDFISAIHRYSPKLLFLCSPNNPTGNLLDLSQVRELIKDFPGIVAIDEAYGEFTRDTSLRLVKEFPNLLVLRTFSKAFGLAGLRIGYCVTSPELAEQLCKVKAPYNINSFSQRAGILTLENIDLVKDRINQIINQRKSYIKL